jgi:hypothetical protein
MSNHSQVATGTAERGAIRHGRREMTRCFPDRALEWVKPVLLVLCVAALEVGVCAFLYLLRAG